MLAVGLGFKFASAEDVREAQSIPVPGQDNTPLQVADQGLFINTADVFEGIAVEKYQLQNPNTRLKKLG